MTAPLPVPPDWTRDALCAQVDPELWFPEKGGSPREAKRVCNGYFDRPACPVREACLQHALDNNERAGVWGGLSEKERARLRRRQAGRAA